MDPVSSTVQALGLFSGVNNDGTLLLLSSVPAVSVETSSATVWVPYRSTKFVPYPSLCFTWYAVKMVQRACIQKIRGVGCGTVLARVPYDTCSYVTLRYRRIHTGTSYYPPYRSTNTGAQTTCSCCRCFAFDSGR